MKQKNIFFIAVFLIAAMLAISGCTVKNPWEQRPAPTPETPAENNVVYLGNAVQSDDNLVVDVMAGNFAAISGIQFGVAYDPAHLEYVSATEGEFLKQNEAMTLFFDLKQFPRQGLVKDIVIARQGGDVSGNGILARLTFKVLKSGTSRVELEEVIAADKDSNKVAVAIQGLDVTTN